MARGSKMPRRSAGRCLAPEGRCASPRAMRSLSFVLTLVSELNGPDRRAGAVAAGLPLALGVTRARQTSDERTNRSKGRLLDFGPTPSELDQSQIDNRSSPQPLLSTLDLK